MKTVRTIIDCDLDYDDAINLWLAAASPREIDLLGITTVAGNFPLDVTQLNARLVAALCGRSDLPVYAGCSRPLFVKAMPYRVGGVDGLDVFDLPGRLMSEHAVDFIIATLRESAAKSVTIVATGPLTNIAMALIRHPDIAASIDRIIMTGSAFGGMRSIERGRELSIHADPHAAGVVFQSGVPLVALGVELTGRLVASSDWIRRFRALGNEVAETAATMLACADRIAAATRGTSGATLHAVCAVAFLIAPELFQTRPCSLQVDTRPGPSLGCTQVSFLPTETVARGVEWGTGIDVGSVLKIVESRLGLFDFVARNVLGGRDGCHAR